MRKSFTCIVERNIEVIAGFDSEPYECGWATEMIVFVRSLEGSLSGETARVQISPDGIHWCDEGSSFCLPDSGQTTFIKVREFGNWIRISSKFNKERRAKIIVTLQMKE